MILLGWGEHLEIIRPEARWATAIHLDGYFGSLYPAEGYVLVASAQRLIRLQPDGSVAWTSDPLGIDGVVVEEIVDGIIKGSGEWDPPGGWCPFRLAVDTGRTIRDGG